MFAFYMLIKLRRLAACFSIGLIVSSVSAPVHGDAPVTRQEIGEQVRKLASSSNVDMAKIDQLLQTMLLSHQEVERYFDGFTAADGDGTYIHSRDLEVLMTSLASYGNKCMHIGDTSDAELAYCLILRTMQRIASINLPSLVKRPAEGTISGSLMSNLQSIPIGSGAKELRSELQNIKPRLRRSEDRSEFSRTLSELSKLMKELQRSTNKIAFELRDIPTTAYATKPARLNASTRKHLLRIHNIQQHTMVNVLNEVVYAQRSLKQDFTRSVAEKSAANFAQKIVTQN